MMGRQFLVMLMLCGVALAVLPAQAVRIWDEPFDYTPDPVNGLHGTGGWVYQNYNWNAAPEVQAGSLDYPLNSSTGNKAVMPGSGGTIAKAAPSEMSNTDGTVLYISRVSGPDGSIYIGDGSYQWQGSKLYLTTRSDLLNVGPYYGGIVEANSGTGSEQQVYAGQGVIGAVNLIVVKVTLLSGPDIVEVMFNPDLSLGEPATWQHTINTIDINAYGAGGTDAPSVFMYHPSSPAQGAAMVDEIRFGDTWADVVPEPATRAVLGLGGLLGLSRKRRA